MLQRKPGVPTSDGLISVIPDPAHNPTTTAETTVDDSVLHLERIAADALDQLRQLTHEHAALSGQVLALERQVRTLLIERLELSAQIAAMQRENAQLRGDHTHLVPTLARPMVLPRPEPLTTLRGGLSGAHRSPQPKGDEETLLLECATSEQAPPPADDAPAEQTPVGYILIAQPFGRFSDLGRFQTAVQALRGVQNARVRRFAQGTLEMRLDYDGPAPLQQALAELALAVEAIEQVEPHRLIIRLRPNSLA